MTVSSHSGQVGCPSMQSMRLVYQGVKALLSNCPSGGVVSVLNVTKVQKKLDQAQVLLTFPLDLRGRRGGEDARQEHLEAQTLGS
jgi:hypothetical protein